MEGDWTSEDEAYNDRIAQLRPEQFPSLADNIYLDHAGTTLYPAALIQRFSHDLTATLWGNTHSASPAAQASAARIAHVRHAVLRFVGADPDHFDLVFVANATAGAKLVADAFADGDGGFWYGYHVDSHTSLIGLRERAGPRLRRCFEADADVDAWLRAEHQPGLLRLLSYPAQSNMNGRRLPRAWCAQLREAVPGAYSLLDAAALASTTPLALGDPAIAPDFTLVSFNKTFGFPDLAGVVVRKAAAGVLTQRRYFGGGTVDLVLALGAEAHIKRTTSIHAALEDGTLPIHSIVALGHALAVHAELYDSMARVSRHTTLLAARLFHGLARLAHANGAPVVRFFSAAPGDAAAQGPILALHVLDACGAPLDNGEVDKLASVHGIHLRTGSVCNPAGIAAALAISADELRRSHALGYRCAQGGTLASGRPAGVVRVSLGAMSTLGDVHALTAFVRDYFATDASVPAAPAAAPHAVVVESLTIYPIKSCAGQPIAPSTPWPATPHGLAWDREWCLVHAGTGKPLSLKTHPHMTRLQPALDPAAHTLTITYHAPAPSPPQTLTIPILSTPLASATANLRRHLDPAISAFFTTALGTPCHLARTTPTTSLANTAPLLTISRASVAALQSLAPGTPTACFRANVVLAPGSSAHDDAAAASSAAWAEDAWSRVRLGGGALEIALGAACRRCAVVCVHPATGARGREPLATLARVRRVRGEVLFGRHGSVVSGEVVQVGMRGVAF